MRKRVAATKGRITFKIMIGTHSVLTLSVKENRCSLFSSGKLKTSHDVNFYVLGKQQIIVVTMQLFHNNLHIPGNK